MGVGSRVGRRLPVGRVIREGTRSGQLLAGGILSPQRLPEGWPRGWEGCPPVESIAGGIKAKELDLLLEARRLRSQVGGSRGELVACGRVLLHHFLELADPHVDLADR